MMPKEKKEKTRASVPKCSQCRRDKQGCLPVNRMWPGQRCNRCVQYEFECSASFLPSQDPDHKRKQPVHPAARIARKDNRELFETIDLLRFLRLYLDDLAPNYPQLVPLRPPKNLFRLRLRCWLLRRKVVRDLDEAVNNLLDAGYYSDARYLIHIATTPLIDDLNDDAPRTGSGTVGIIERRDVCRKIEERLLKEALERATRWGCIFHAQIIRGKILQRFQQQYSISKNGTASAGSETSESEVEAEEQELPPLYKEAIRAATDNYARGTERLMKFCGLTGLNIRCFHLWPFHHGCFLKLPSLLKTLTEIHRREISKFRNIFGENALHLAARTGCAFAVYTFLKVGVEDMKPDMYGLKPFMTAHINRQNPTAQMFLMYCRNAYNPDGSCLSNIRTNHEAYCMKFRAHDVCIVRTSEPAHGSEVRYWTTLQLVYHLNLLDSSESSEARYLLDYVKQNTESPEWKRRLMAAQILGMKEVSVLQALLQDDRHLVTHREVVLAASIGATDALQFLCEHYATTRPDRTDALLELQSALDIAMEKGQWECIQILLDYGVPFRCSPTEILESQQGWNGRSDAAIALMVRYEFQKELELEDRDGPFFQHAIDNWGSSVLDKALPRMLDWESENNISLFKESLLMDNVGLAEALVKRGAPLHTAEFDDQTAFDFSAKAAQGETLDILKMLMAHDASIVDGGSDALIHAAEAGRIDVMEMLLDRGVSIDSVSPENDDQTALIIAADRGDVACMKFLIDRGADVRCRDKWRSTALHAAASSDCCSAEVVKCLLDGGVDADAVDYSCNTALHQMLRKLFVHSMSFESPASLMQSLGMLLDRMSPGMVNHQGYNGQTPLHVLLESENLWDISRLQKPVLFFLYQRGASTQIMNSYGETPVDVARRSESENREILNALENLDKHVGGLDVPVSSL